MAEWNPELTPNFTRTEMSCKCGCGRAEMDADFMLMLQGLRDRIGPMTITSGYRCPNHPEEKKKSKPGAHSAGLAADFISLKADRWHVLKHVMVIEFPGVGIAKSFIHVDGGHPSAHRPASWTY